MEPVTVLALTAAALAVVALRKKGQSSRASATPTAKLAYPEPKLAFGVPFAAGSAMPAWPTVTSNSRKFDVSYVDVSDEVHGNYSRRFGAVRKEAGTDRHHVGVDLYANAKDVVVATEAGTVVKYYNTYNLNSGVLYLATDSGLTVVYGEVEPKSWEDYGIHQGIRVARGQPLARIACMKGTPSNCESHMLHFETYAGIVDKDPPSWYQGSPAAPNMRNPTRYLLWAKQFAQSIG